MNEIENGDDIYFDVTHSFRTNPVVALIVLNYARFLKRATIGKMMYGWIEELGSFPEIKAMNVVERLAPIVDFTNMALLLDWTNGVDQYLRTGDASKIKELTEGEAQRFFTRDANESDKVDKEDRRQFGKLQKLANRMEQTSLAFQTCRGRSYIDKIRELRREVERVKQLKTKHVRPLLPLVDEIEAKYADFTDDEVMNSYYAVSWCVDHGLIQLAYTLLQEYVISIVCLQINWLG